MSQPILEGQDIVKLIMKNHLNIDLSINSQQLNLNKINSRASRIYLAKKKRFFDVTTPTALKTPPKCSSQRQGKPMRSTYTPNVNRRSQPDKIYFSNTFSQQNPQKRKQYNTNNISYSERQFLSRQLEDQFKKVDAKFKLENYLGKSRFDKFYQSSQNNKMIELLSLEKSLINQSKSSKTYKLHNRFIRKLRRIYQNKEKDQTELSTKENEELKNQQHETNQKANSMNFEARQIKWQLLRKQMNDSKRNLSAQNNNAENLPSPKKFFFDSKGQDIFGERVLRKKVIQLKKINSPMTPIIQKFKRVINHYYIDFNVKFKRILDFYCDNNIKINSNEDELQTYETTNQEKVFEQQAMMVMK